MVWRDDVIHLSWRTLRLLTFELQMDCYAVDSTSEFSLNYVYKIYAFFCFVFVQGFGYIECSFATSAVAASIFHYVSKHTHTQNTQILHSPPISTLKLYPLLCISAFHKSFRLFVVRCLLFSKYIIS